MPIDFTEKSSTALKTLKPKKVFGRDENDVALQEILLEIRKVVAAQQFDVWFSGLEISSINKNSISFITPNAFVKEWLCSNYIDVFSGAVYRVLNSSREVVFLTEDEAQGQLSASSYNTAPLPGEFPVSERQTNSLNGYYSFDNFVVGPSNRLAHAAALAVSESPGLAYNPLFIHGASGLGKTHLLHAVNNVLLPRRTLKTLYLSCEHFINHFISTIRSNNWDEFRNLYRNLDVLLLDDIQFFENLQGCREEFFHTFNALYNAKKQIIITSDCPPESLHSLEDRLVSRFKWGLLCSIDSPTIETRVAIAEKKASLMNLNLTHDLASHLAEHVPGSIRELEGAIVRLGKELKITRNTITLDVIKKVVREITGNKNPVSIEAILHAVSNRFNVSISQLQSKSRVRSLTLPRQIAMYLSRKLTNMSLMEIGGFIGGRDHSTVIHAEEKITKLQKKDKNLLFVLQKIESELQR